MESSALSFPPVFPRIEMQQNFLRARSFGSGTSANSISYCVVSVVRVSQDCSSGRGCYGGDFSRFCCDLAFLDRGLGRKRLQRRRRGEEVGDSWKRWRWRSLRVESESDGHSAGGSVHFVGIGGSGLSALALLALQQVRSSIANPSREFLEIVLVFWFWI